MIRKFLVSATLAVATGLSGFTETAVALPANPDLSFSRGQNVDVQTIHHRRHRIRPGFYLHGPGPGYFNGYRGRRHRHPGWRYHNGWWFPPAAFALGVIIGKGIHGGTVYHQPAPRYYRPSSPPGEHYRWCDWRFKTYRAWDNTYIPRRGVRAQCRSPYWP